MPARSLRLIWHPEDIEALISLRAAGVSYRTIARKLNRTIEACRKAHQKFCREQKAS